MWWWWCNCVGAYIRTSTLTPVNNCIKKESAKLFYQDYIMVTEVFLVVELLWWVYGNIMWMVQCKMIVSMLLFYVNKWP